MTAAIVLSGTGGASFFQAGAGEVSRKFRLSTPSVLGNPSQGLRFHRAGTTLGESQFSGFWMKRSIHARPGTGSRRVHRTGVFLSGLPGAATGKRTVPGDLEDDFRGNPRQEDGRRMEWSD